MKNVWKIGTRWSDWGDSSASILSIMRRNNTAFVWLEEKDKAKFLKDVTKGDYIALADGYQIVAIGKTTSDAGYLKDFKNFQVSEHDFSGFSLEDGKDQIVAVKINIVDIEDGDRHEFYFQKQHRFCSLNQLWNEVIDYYENHVNKFEIKSYTATIGNSEVDGRILINNKATYIIPIYQRPYEWSDRQIRPFVNDILANFMGKDGSGRLPEPMFIGTMQLSKRKPISNNEYQHEVVDGQQRITTLTIMLHELQKNFPQCKKLSSLEFKWLKTHVSEQQSIYLYNYLFTEENEPLNPYYKGATIIWDSFEQFLQNQEEEIENQFDIDKFCDYLFTKVCFVVIETSAGLSKTIQIFNTINNSGLDLNGSDLFKIRMYEYLRDVKLEDESVFEKIQEIYTLVDVMNTSHQKEFHMGTMLDMYKNILITEYNLNNTLYAYAWDTFFDRLFDSILGINEWEHFKNLNGLEISLDTLKVIIEMRYQKLEYEYSYLETKFATKMISEYSRYRWSKELVMYPFLYFYRNNSDKYIQLERLLIVLNKYFFIHSIEHSKQINPVNAFITRLVKSMKNVTSEEVIQSVITQIASEDDDIFRWAIGRDLINGSKWWKYLVCGVSVFLEERHFSDKDEHILSKIFNRWEFDIEHIHATADMSMSIPDELQNSIGNLTPLELDINRSIQNAQFKEKRVYYNKSKYKIIQDIAKLNDWDITNIQLRRKEEVQKIFDYIKREKELSFCRALK